MTTRVQLKFPPQLAQAVHNNTHVEFAGDRFSDLLNSLEQHYGGVKERLLDDTGRVRPFLNVFVGRDNLNALDGMNTVLLEGQCVSILLARAGG
jgi:sulfur-carrier protein